MVMKECSRCRSEKTYSEFYRNHKYSDGYFSYCKDCHKLGTARLRKDNYEHYRTYDTQRARDTNRWQTYRAKYPERYLAGKTLNNAIRDGKIVPQCCWVCGNKAEAHHPDYSRPLDVVWLCKKHHEEVHHMV